MKDPPSSNSITDADTNHIDRKLHCTETEITKLIFFTFLIKVAYEPVQAFTLIWLPPWVHFRVLQNTAKTGKIMFFHTCQGT